MVAKLVASVHAIHLDRYMHAFTSTLNCCIMLQMSKD